MKTKPSIFKQLSVYMGNKKILLYLAMLSSGLSAVCNIVPLYFIWQIVRELISKQNNLSSTLIINNALLAVVFAVLAMLLYFAALMFSHLAAFEAEINIKKYAFEKALKMPLGFFSKNMSGKLRKVINDGAASTHTFLAHQLPDLAATIITPLILLALMLLFDWRLGLVSLIPIVISFVLMFGMMMTEDGKNFQKRYLDQLEVMSSESVEYVRAIPVVKTFGQSIYAFTRFYDSIQNYKKLVFAYTLLWTKPMSLYSTFIQAAAFFIIPLALLLIGWGESLAVVLSNFVLYLLVAPNFGLAIMKSAYLMENLNIAGQALERIDDILKYPRLNYGTAKIDPNNIDIVFKNVSFTYEGTKTKAINTVSFTVKKGQTLALVGPSGGGKTTIARLCARFWDSDSGEILIGGKNIREYSQAQLMENIAFVFQNNKLFKTTLRDNILLGNKQANAKDLTKAVQQSQSQEIIDKIGLEALIGKEGTYLSGGEQQRISLARAILKDAPIVILDEATAFSDPENEHLIQKALQQLSKGKTTIMIAHRLTTVQKADLIAVLENGQITEYGSHEQLIKQGKTYKKMWDEYQHSVKWKISNKKEEF